jgi:ATP-dependent Clp protease ATP-binding subunit ClpC
MFENFTDQAREAIAYGQREASELGHPEVGVEHLLLGLVSLRSGAVAKLWADLGLTVPTVRLAVRERLGESVGQPSRTPLPFSPEAKAALRMAHRFGMGEPGAELMLAVLLARGEGGASAILRAVGADPNSIRAEMKKQIRPGPGAPSGDAVEPLRVTVRAGILDDLEFEI